MLYVIQKVYALKCCKQLNAGGQTEGHTVERITM
jgi:hypothetical protein